MIQIFFITASESGESCWFVSAEREAELFICLHYGLGYFRITGPLSRMAQDCDPLVFFGVLAGIRLTKAYACRYLTGCARLNQ